MPISIAQLLLVVHHQLEKGSAQPFKDAQAQYAPSDVDDERVAEAKRFFTACTYKAWTLDLDAAKSALKRACAIAGTPAQAKVVNEYLALEARLGRLDRRIERGPHGDALELDRMKRQSSAMRAYADVLLERVRAF